MPDKMNILAIHEIEEKLSSINSEWSIIDNAVQRTFQFENFVQAWAFMTAVALIAEKQKHHPDWKNVYNLVVIRLNTHDVNGITNKDFKLAKAIDALY